MSSKNRGKAMADDQPPVEFDEQEKELLRKYFRFYESLSSGARTPSTPAQVHFVSVCQGRAGISTEHERAWMKHKKLEAWERAHEQRRLDEQRLVPETEEGIPTAGWFTDEDWKKLRAADFADLNARNRE
jgi:uncharacterized protein YifE (UPF0438 family)